MFNFNPTDHYWHRENGALYSSTQQMEVSADNPQYKEWLAAGNMPTPYPKDEAGNESPAELQKVLDVYGLAMYPPTDEELLRIKQAAITEAVQARLDAFAHTRNYDNIFTAATYAASTNPQFAAEGQYAVEARDLTWAKCYQILNDVLTGQRPEPILEEILSELPALTWPEV